MRRRNIFSAYKTKSSKLQFSIPRTSYLIVLNISLELHGTGAVDRPMPISSLSQKLLNLLQMQLHAIEEKDKTFTLPRVHQQFIGLGHELELHRRQRRQAQLEHQAIENRVLLLQKQQTKARKDLMRKKQQLEQIINIRQRQQQQSEEKARNHQQKMQELERLKRQNEINRMIHKSNYQSNLSQLRDRNHSQYTKIRQERLDGQYSKRANKNHDLQEKRDNWLSLNISKEKGKARIDSFYKRKNKQHVKEYQSRIYQENQERQSRINSIKNLQMRQKSLRTKIENVSMKNSKMQQLLKSISRTLSPMDTSQIEAELYGTSRVKKSHQTLFLTEREKPVPVTRTNSGEEHSYSRSRSNDVKESFNNEVEENIELGSEDAPKSQFKIVHKRRKNKHINRYKEYQAY